jgi:hypothetical protein
MTQKLGKINLFSQTEFTSDNIWSEVETISRSETPPTNAANDSKPPAFIKKDAPDFLTTAKLYLDYVLSLDKIKIDGHLTEFLSYDGVVTL